MSVSYTMTDDVIAVIYDGKGVVVNKNAPNFQQLKKALAEGRWKDVPKHLSTQESVNSWLGGKFVMKGDDIFYKDEPIQKELTARILSLVREQKDPQMLFDFWENLSKNPSHRSISQLYTFLNHQGIPLSKGGKFLAYKAVRRDWKDIHSGTFMNTVGTINKMDRSKVSDDPNHACHEGLHVGSLEYAQHFGGSDCRIVICEVDPKNVVCVPYDYGFQKMRVCEYKVVGVEGGELPSTSFEPEDLGPEEEEDRGFTAFSKLDSMSYRELMGQSTEDLRKYAARSLNIIGASKLKGGKSALVDRIIRARK